MVTAKRIRLATFALEYPLLQIVQKTGLVVLFTAESTGTCVCPGHSTYGIGQTLDSWDEVDFAPYHGEITLRNS